MSKYHLEGFTKNPLTRGNENSNYEKRERERGSKDKSRDRT